MKREYNKLVRDRIPEIIEQEGKKYNIRIASDEELFQYLLQKVREELNELEETPSVEEMADVQESLDALKDLLSIDGVSLAATMKAKRERRGAFKNKIILLDAEDSDE